VDARHLRWEFFVGVVANRDHQIPMADNVVQVRGRAGTHVQSMAPRGGDCAGVNFGRRMRAGRGSRHIAASIPDSDSQLAAG